MQKCIQTKESSVRESGENSKWEDFFNSNLLVQFKQKKFKKAGFILVEKYRTYVCNHIHVMI